MFYYRFSDKIEMALFVIQYTSHLLIFALGLRAPGILDYSQSNYESFDDHFSRQSRFHQQVSPKPIRFY